MAAELERLIELYRSHGLHAAAEHLSVAEAGLLARGVLPPQLRRGLLSTEDSEGAREVEIHHGHVRLKGPLLPLSSTYEIDTLGLSRRARNALLDAGISTIADLEWANRHELLHLVHQLGVKSIREIAAKIEEPRPYLLSKKIPLPAPRSASSTSLFLPARAESHPPPDARRRRPPHHSGGVQPE